MHKTLKKGEKMDFGGFNLDKAKELLGGGAGDLDAKTIVNLLQKMLQEPEKGNQIVENLSRDAEGGANVIEIVQKLYSYAKQFGLL